MFLENTCGFTSPVRRAYKMSCIHLVDTRNPWEEAIFNDRMVDGFRFIAGCLCVTGLIRFLLIGNKGHVVERSVDCEFLMRQVLMIDACLLSGWLLPSIGTNEVTRYVE